MPARQNNILNAHILFHIQIGVTGHRDLAFTAQLEKSIGGALTTGIKNLLGWDEKYNTRLSFSIFSPVHSAEKHPGPLDNDLSGFFYYQLYY